MTKAINDAMLKKVGDTYQYLIELKDCFKLNDDYTLQIETNGDEYNRIFFDFYD